MGANQVRSHFDLDLHLTAGHGDTAPCRGFADTETSPGIPYVSGADFELKPSRSFAPYIEISIATQQFDTGGFRIADSDAAVFVKTNIDIWRRGDGDPLSRFRFVEPRAQRLGNEP